MPFLQDSQSKNNNLNRRVSGYIGVPRLEELYPSLLPQDVKRTSKGYRSKITEFLCGCVVREYMSGISIRAGCGHPHFDAVRFRCTHCGQSFKQKDQLKDHAWKHAI